MPTTRRSGRMVEPPNLTAARVTLSTRRPEGSYGNPSTADDVVYTWQLMMNPQSGFDTSVEDKLKNVDKVDDYTVRFTYLSANEARAFDPERFKDLGSEPVTDPLYMFGMYDAPAIYPRHKLREIIGDDPRHAS